MLSAESRFLLGRLGCASVKPRLLLGDLGGLDGVVGRLGRVSVCRQLFIGDLGGASAVPWEKKNFPSAQHRFLLGNTSVLSVESRWSLGRVSVRGEKHGLSARF